jgi:hypothetical protein
MQALHLQPEAFNRTLEAGTSAAYAAGLADPIEYRNPRLAVCAAREAVDSWRAALNDHAETSYWTVARIQSFRAYWLGKLRAARLACQLEGLRP